MHKFSSRASSRSSSSLRGSKATLEESLMAIRATIWPRPNLKRFTEILDASPNLVKMVVGEKGETLLHRLADSFQVDQNNHFHVKKGEVFLIPSRGITQDKG